MSNLQITTVILTTLIGILIEFFLGRKMIRAFKRDMGDYFVHETYAGGAYSAIACMLASVPGIGTLIALRWILDVKYTDGIFLLIGAAFFITSFVAIYGPGIRPPKDRAPW